MKYSIAIFVLGYLALPHLVRTINVTWRIIRRSHARSSTRRWHESIGSLQSD